MPAANDIILWADMVPALSIKLVDCPTFTIEEALKDAAQTFYRDSRAWREEDVDLGVTFADERNYEAVEIPELEMVGIPQAWVNGEEVEELAAEERSPSSTASDTEYDMQIGVTGPWSFRLVPAPTEGGWSIVGTVAYMPSDDATGIPWRLWRQHREAIEAMALADLKDQAGKPWSDPAGAMRQRGTAEAAMLRFSTEAGPVRRVPRLRARIW